MVLPISVIIPTKNRKDILLRTLASLSNQSSIPAQVIIIDASSDPVRVNEITIGFPEIIIEKAIISGSAQQRNQGLLKSSQEFILFMDDDILLEAGCIEILWKGIQSDENVGGVNALITNQKYHLPGFFSRILYSFLSEQNKESYAGACFGPALNLLPSDNSNLPDFVKVDWLNTTCTLYKKNALPLPAFDHFFEGYSFMEDVALSLKVASKRKLLNARKAKIFHDSQPGFDKNNGFRMAFMETKNRYYIMTRIMNKKSLKDIFKFLVLDFFILLSYKKRINASVLAGKAKAYTHILSHKL